MSTEQLLSADDLQRRLTLGRTRVYEILRSGEIDVIKIGRRLFVTEQDLSDWIARCRRPAWSNDRDY